jgi:hypothetical protein
LKKFKEEIQELGNKILQAALALHERVSSTFRKTAVNFHYEVSTAIALLCDAPEPILNGQVCAVFVPSVPNHGCSCTCGPVQPLCCFVRSSLYATWPMSSKAC